MKIKKKLDNKFLVLKHCCENHIEYTKEIKGWIIYQKRNFDKLDVVDQQRLIDTGCNLTIIPYPNNNKFNKTLDSLDNDTTMTEQSTEYTTSIITKKSESNYASSVIPNAPKKIIPIIATNHHRMRFDINEYDSAKGLLSLSNQVMRNKPFVDICEKNKLMKIIQIRLILTQKKILIRLLYPIKMKMKNV